MDLYGGPQSTLFLWEIVESKFIKISLFSKLAKDLFGIYV